MFFLVAFIGILSTTRAQQPCYNAILKTNGSCISITDCTIFNNILHNRSRTAEEVQLLRESRCGSLQEIPKICCVASEIDFPEGNCGYYDRSGLIRNEYPDFGQYAWLALIKYDEENHSCEGSIVSDRYVLTAAQCLIGRRPKNVILGEYDLNTDPDCMEIAGGLDCADPIKIIPIENHTNNQVIGLIKLTLKMTWTDFITPICLPSSKYFKALDTDDRAYIAGWAGTANRSKKRDSQIKIENIDENVITVSCRSVKGCCYADVGGPLMMFLSTNNYRSKVFIVGMYTVSKEQCIKFINLKQHLKWIQNNMLL